MEFSKVYSHPSSLQSLKSPSSRSMLKWGQKLVKGNLEDAGFSATEPKGIPRLFAMSKVQILAM